MEPAGRVLAIGAHPDDIELGCGGTLARLAGQGWSSWWVVATRGEAGSLNRDPHDLANIRQKEAEAAAALLEAREIIHLGLPDGLTSFTPEMKMPLIDLVRRIRPDLVFVHSRSDRFPDHAVVSALTLSALTAAGGPWYPASRDAAAGLLKDPPFESKPWVSGTVLGYEVWQPLNEHQLAVDITETIETKVAALRCHVSQVGPTRYDEAARGLARYRGVMAFSGDYAEVFEVIRMGRLPTLT